MIARLVLALVVVTWLVLMVLSTGLDKLVLGTELQLSDNIILNSVATFSLGALVGLISGRPRTPKNGSEQ